MAFKHYDVVRAASPSDLAERITQKLKEGWQPYGSALISTAGYGAEFIQPVVSEGSISSPEEPGNRPTTSAPSVAPEYYYVIALAGQSNGMSYGEGLPLPDTFDSPDPRIKQLARRSTVTPGGAACKYNDIIPADHCLHDVQDMSRLNHPKADLSKGQYGTVGQGLHIAKKLLPFIPANAGILLVPCCRGGSAFTTGADGTYSDASGASENSTRWGVDKPLYKDLIGYNDIIPADHCLHDVQDMSRLNHPKADLSKGQYGTVGQGLHIAKKLLPFIPANAGILLVPCCRGGSAFTTGADGTYSDASGASENSTRWGVDKPLYKDLIGRTKAALKKNPKNVLFAVVWMQGEFDFGGTPVNHAAQFGALVDKFRADLADMAGQCVGGSAGGVPWICGDTTYFWKQKNESTYQTVYGSYKNKTEKNIHFVPFMTDENGVNVPTNKPEEDPDIPGIGYYGSKWRDSSATWTSQDRASHFSSWARRGIISDRLATAILRHAGRVALNAGASSTVSEVSSLPQGVALTGDGGNNLLAAFYIQTDAKDLNVMYHNAKVATNNLKLGTFGAFDNEWHTLAFRFAGNNSLQVTPVIDGQDGTPFTLTQSPVSAFAADKLHVTDITRNATYPVLIDSIVVEVNSTDTAA
ncbi:SASA family carbohydrate esterase [Escherichia coli]|uniref:SASA family carbohydrate esterase n=1 Tax=Escherichia coli TaxID=562 RepID=UPI00201DBE0B|nr:SASA family carbohydrate esterase [Escherichia coli]